MESPCFVLKPPQDTKVPEPVVIGFQVPEQNRGIGRDAQFVSRSGEVLDRSGALGHVELLAPLSDEGNIAAFIAKKGPGLHHIALAADDIEVVMERCRAAGMRLLDEKPRTGAGGKKIVFMHPKSGGGVLIEICTEA